MIGLQTLHCFLPKVQLINKTSLDVTSYTVLLYKSSCTVAAVLSELCDFAKMRYPVPLSYIRPASQNDTRASEVFEISLLLLLSVRHSKPISGEPVLTQLIYDQIIKQSI